MSFTASGYTGKERDAESGLDYFGARYYASNMGRWMSPDWSAKEEPVPYAKLDDPQSLNLYAYVGNNPLSHADADGHEQDPLDPQQMASVAHDINAVRDWWHQHRAGVIRTLNHPAVQAYLSVIPMLGAEAGAAGEVESGLAYGAARSESVWSLGNGPRGLAIESELGGNLPAGFPTIDRFSNGVATSIKSLDLSASSYQNAGTLASTVTGYVDKVAGFNGGKLGTTVIGAGQITGRELQLAVPGAGTAAQQAALKSASSYAAQQGVKLTITQVK